MSLSILKNSLEILLLYTSKLGAIFVGLYVLPMYREMLGAYTFGLVAVILSIQTFLITFDFGVSTIVTRDFAAESTKASCRNVLLGGHLVIHIAYLLLFVVGFLVLNVISFNLSLFEYFLLMILFWAMTIQNVSQSALIAQKNYVISSLYQIVGTIIRALFTLIVLQVYEANLSVFLFAQSSIAVLHAYMVTRVCCKQIKLPVLEFNCDVYFQSAISIFSRGRPLIVFNLAGAAVMQLDKVLLGATNAPEKITPYFLASVFCLTPISVFGGPLNQYFQPKIINCIAQLNGFAFRRQVGYLITSIILMVVVPSIMMWLGREALLKIWLRQSNEIGTISRYVKVLLPGVAFGALGYIPFTILTACQDFRWQAKASAVLTALTLIATGFASLHKSIETVCWIYAAYHVISTLVISMRARNFIRRIFVGGEPLFDGSRNI